MLNDRHPKFRRLRLPIPWVAAVILIAIAETIPATAQDAQAPQATQSPTLEELITAVVQVKTQIDPQGTTVPSLGREREGSGIVIGADGLVLTIGYLMVEATSAELIMSDGRTVPASVVGYDHETGFGLLRSLEPLKVNPLPLGKSSDVKQLDIVAVAAGGGPDMVAPAVVVSKRQFAGDWEYMVDDALFTSPPHPSWSGAALINRDGKLVGVGSLIVGDASGDTEKLPGNMFVPIDTLAPILGDLLAFGRPGGPGRPWLGVATEAADGELVVRRVTRGGPAEKAGLRAGDVIAAVNGEGVKNVSDFYRKMWAIGGAGAVVPLDVRQNDTARHLDVKSVNRLDQLKLKSTY